jgi:hypothetical protein
MIPLICQAAKNWYEYNDNAILDWGVGKAKKGGLNFVKVLGEKIKDWPDLTVQYAVEGLMRRPIYSRGG